MRQQPSSEITWDVTTNFTKGFTAFSPRYHRDLSLWRSPASSQATKRSTGDLPLAAALHHKQPVFKEIIPVVMVEVEVEVTAVRKYG